jgi:hypothetical protein
MLKFLKYWIIYTIIISGIPCSLFALLIDHKLLVNITHTEMIITVVIAGCIIAFMYTLGDYKKGRL